MVELVRFRFVTKDKRASQDVADKVRRQIRSTAAKLTPGTEPQITIEPESPEHQDAGSIIAILLAGPTVVAVAKVFAEWACDRGYGLEVSLPSGTKVILKNADREMVEKTIQSYANR
jgi:hypothetical protein